MSEKKRQLVLNIFLHRFGHHPASCSPFSTRLGAPGAAVERLAQGICWRNLPR
ncbi:hypothetical protein D3C78_1728640 [compost metagenome]